MFNRFTIAALLLLTSSVALAQSRDGAVLDGADADHDGKVTKQEFLDSRAEQSGEAVRAFRYQPRRCARRPEQEAARETARSARRRSASATGASSSDLQLQHDAPDGIAVAQMLESCLVLIERKHPVDDRVEPMLRDERAHAQIVGARADIDAARARGLVQQAKRRRASRRSRTSRRRSIASRHTRGSSRIDRACPCRRRRRPGRRRDRSSAPAPARSTSDTSCS